MYKASLQVFFRKRGHASAGSGAVGGAVANLDNDTYLEITNCTFTQNNASHATIPALGTGGRLYHLRGEVTIMDTIIANNSASGVEKDYGYFDGTVNTTDTYIFDPTGHSITLGNGLNPHFMTIPDPAPSLTGDLRLKPWPHLINAGTGDESSVFASILDLAGNPRVFESKIDVGAYENQNFLHGETGSDITMGPALYSADVFFHGFNVVPPPPAH